MNWSERLIKLSDSWFSTKSIEVEHYLKKKLMKLWDREL